MSLALLQNYRAIAPGLSVPFGATGGTAPYVFSVFPGGAGGSINPSTGVYSSPSGSYGVDTVIVTDAALATAQGIISVDSPIQLVRDIIRQYMNLGNDQIYIYNQKYFIPTDPRIYVAIGFLNQKCLGNNNRFTSDGADQYSVWNATLSIDMLSRSMDALHRKEEVIMALASDYAESQMELNSFRVFSQPTSFLNLSGLDGDAIPYRFNISVVMQYFIRKTIAVPYYDDFPTVAATFNE